MIYPGCHTTIINDACSCRHCCAKIAETEINKISASNTMLRQKLASNTDFYNHLKKNISNQSETNMRLIDKHNGTLTKYTKLKIYIA